MSQNGQTHFENLAANAAVLLKCARTFWGILHERFKRHNTYIFTDQRRFVTKEI